jgi:hypothetical protein
VLIASLILGCVALFLAVELWLSRWIDKTGLFKNSILLVGAFFIGTGAIGIKAHIVSIVPKDSTPLAMPAGPVMPAQGPPNTTQPQAPQLPNDKAAAPTSKSVPPTPPSEVYPYPWVSARQTNAMTTPITVPLFLNVLDYPPKPGNIGLHILSIRTIDSVRVVISIPKAIIGQGLHSCEYRFERSEWSNSYSPSRGIGLIVALPLLNEVTVVHVRASARNGAWGGYILLRKRDKDVDYEQVLHGTVISSRDNSEHRMKIKEARYDGRVTRNEKIPDRLTDAMLIEHGVPVSGPEAARVPCEKLQQNQ